MEQSTSKLGRHAVVIGGSMAGLVSARVLADHFDRVTVFERDRLPEAADPRRGVPQARHVHVLLMSGRRVLDRLFPGLVDEYRAAGATELDTARDVAWLTGFGWGVRFESDMRVIGATRDLIEWGVRRRVAADPRIHIRSDADVSGLVLDPTG